MKTRNKPGGPKSSTPLTASFAMPSLYKCGNLRGYVMHCLRSSLAPPSPPIMSYVTPISFGRITFVTRACSCLSCCLFCRITTGVFWCVRGWGGAVLCYGRLLHPFRICSHLSYVLILGGEIDVSRVNQAFLSVGWKLCDSLFVFVPASTCASLFCR